MRFVKAHGLRLPFRDQAFEVVHSSAVIEHVGSLGRQCAFVAECCRVARRAVFITTPNRWFPIEFHTVLPLVHWLPAASFRGLLHRSGRAFFADENNLNLMGRGDVLQAAERARIGSSTVDHVSLGGWRTHPRLIARKSA